MKKISIETGWPSMSRIGSQIFHLFNIYPVHVNVVGMEARLTSQ